MPGSSTSLLVKLRLQSSIDDIKTKNFWKSSVAECFGTFILVFIGLGSCYGKSELLGAALAFGFAATLGIWAIAPISGGNINPAVSLGLLVARKMSLFRCVMYMIFQFLGAAVAAKFIEMMTASFNVVHGISFKNVPALPAFFCEVVVTFILVFTVMRMCVEKARSDIERGVGAFAIGLSIVVGILCSAHISGGSMNPARSLGPAVVNARLDDIWIYIAGPLVGGVLAGFLQQVLFTSELSKWHVLNYLCSPTFGCEVSYEKQGEDVESNGSYDKNNLKNTQKTSSKNSPQKNCEKHELLEDDSKLNDVLEMEA